jgi:hypothetical protein
MILKIISNSFLYIYIFRKIVAIGYNVLGLGEVGD